MEGVRTNMEYEARRWVPLPSATAVQIRGTLSTLWMALRDLAPDKMREMSREVDEKAAAADHIYYQLLHLAENLSLTDWLYGIRKPILQLCNVSDLVYGLCEAAVSLLEDKGLRLTFTLPPETISCAVDADALHLAFTQLLSNAVKFVPAGGSVHVELWVQDKHLHLSVEDDGPGIPADLLAVVLDRGRTTAQAAPAPHGLGLGLPLCRAITEAHGGQFLLDTAPGQGCRVVLTIPANLEENCVAEAMPVEYSAGFNRTLLDLADALPSSAFRLRSQG